IIKWIQQYQSSWSTQTLTDNEGKQFIIALSNALWYIDICDRTKLQERNFHIPQLFLEFLDRANPKA
ncbi:1869_t:CDS:1, partial [Gigaspora margarita]